MHNIKHWLEDTMSKLLAIRLNVHIRMPLREALTSFLCQSCTHIWCCQQVSDGRDGQVSATAFHTQLPARPSLSSSILVSNWLSRYSLVSTGLVSCRVGTALPPAWPWKVSLGLLIPKLIYCDPTLILPHPAVTPWGLKKVYVLKHPPLHELIQRARAGPPQSGTEP